MAEVFEGLRSVAEAELYATDKRNTFEKLDSRIRRCNMELSRFERDPLRLTKHFKNEGASHNSNKKQPHSPIFHIFSTVAGNRIRPRAEKSDFYG